MIDSTEVERLKAWVRSGGTLVATEGSALFLTKKRSGLTGVELASDQEEKEDEEAEGPPSSAYTTYAARQDSSGPHLT